MAFLHLNANEEAAKVVAADVNPMDRYCLKLTHDILGSKVKFHHMNVYELDANKLGGKFDLVMFPGVFYHLRHIILLLDNIWSVLKDDGEIIMETHVCDQHFVLGDGTVTKLENIDPRLTDTLCSGSIVEMNLQQQTGATGLEVTLLPFLIVLGVQTLNLSY